MDIASYASRTTSVVADIGGGANDGNASDGAVGARDDIGTDIDGIAGGSGNDTLTGNAYDNWFDGGGGADIFNGMGGEDTVSYGNRALGVIADIGGGANDGNASDGLVGARDNVMPDVEDLTGTSGDDTLIGSAGPNQLDGRLGVDTLRGLGGNDTLFARDGKVDAVIDCDGAGSTPGTADKADVDLSDPVSIGCETITHP